ncbi:hypothetical protein DFH07DRAFT_846088 [Mycena maculata]|uniref:Uncharacterized protein n=1 Tax=Mycena maculata TaxID=230809 RepID=A0AAD7I2D6_9AGAR|nr:hypothetical protein DFH07DRAFT_846088 [Mycena maculata]
MGNDATSRYDTVCAMILESGALYVAGGLVFLIVLFRFSVVPIGPDPITNGAILGQLVGIAPTIIAVRVGLGKIQSNQPVQPLHSIERRIVSLGPESTPDYSKAEVV